MVKTGYKGVPQRRQNILSKHRQWANKTTNSISVYGDGQDGNITLTSNTTLIKDMLYNNLTVQPGVTLFTGGYRIFVKNLLTVRGTISNPGSDSPGGTTGGSAAPSVTVGNGITMNGATGRNGTGNGFNGTSIDFLGAAGGAGGNASPSVGGNPDSPTGLSFDTSDTVSMGRGAVFIYDVAQGVVTGNAGTDMIQGGGGGGGGAAQSSTGGGAGGGGGVISISARYIKVGSGGLITAPGGNGADASGSNAGGGGGGGGGVVLLLCDTYSGPDPYSPGGLGGAGSGAGENGQPGQNGAFVKRFRQFKV